MSVEFAPIPFERFDAFHRAFDGEGNGMWQICAECGGKCEQHKIGSLMPGEKEYISHQLGLPLATFEAHYLDRVVTPRGDVDVLKLVPGCPFLDSCFHCTLADRKVKPVLCEIYPVVAEVYPVADSSGSLSLQVKFLVDEIDCPLLHLTYTWSKHQVHNLRWQEYRNYFATQGIERLRQVDAEPEWYWAVELYDSENFDYEALRRLRKAPANEYSTFTLDDLLSCSLGHEL